MIGQAILGKVGAILGQYVGTATVETRLRVALWRKPTATPVNLSIHSFINLTSHPPWSCDPRHILAPYNVGSHPHHPTSERCELTWSFPTRDEWCQIFNIHLHLKYYDPHTQRVSQYTNHIYRVIKTSDVGLDSCLRFNPAKKSISNQRRYWWIPSEIQGFRSSTWGWRLNLCQETPCTSGELIQNHKSSHSAGCPARCSWISSWSGQS